MPENLTRLVRSRSSRGGVPPIRIVLHTTEGHNRPGVSDLTGLASYFDGAQASSHLGIDAEGNCVRMVPDEEKAWTQAGYNPGSLSIEQVGFSSQSKTEWMRNYHPGLIRVAQACAHWALKYPRIKLRTAVDYGVCEHRHLGQFGGGHSDCGEGYPRQYVIYLARIHYYKHRGWNKLPAVHPRRVLLASYYAAVHRAERKYVGHTLT